MVSALKELLIVDPQVLDDARARGSGPWSFGALLASLAPPGSSEVAIDRFARGWINQWVTASQVNQQPVRLKPEVSSNLLKSWPTRSVPCGSATCEILDLARAPMTLIAIVSRLDLATGPEGRLAYSMTGPLSAPDPTAGFTLIFEFALPSSVSSREWARSWHELGATDPGPAYNAKLASLVARFSARENFKQLRTNEFSRGSASWDFRQFELNALGELVLSPLDRTPHDRFLRSSGNEQDEILAWLTQQDASGQFPNWKRVCEEKHELPPGVEGGSSDAFLAVSKSWLPSLEASFPRLRKRFATQTCNGCHSFRETATIHAFFHLAPRASGEPTRFSDFLAEDLERRSAHLKCLLSPRCCAPSTQRMLWSRAAH